MKDDAGSYAVFTEQGSSGSQMTAAKKSWTLFQGYQDAQDKQQMQHPPIPRSKWKTHQLFFKKKNPKSECPDIWIHLPEHKWPKSCSSMEDPVVPLERNL